jgi:hypothetical protein
MLQLFFDELSSDVSSSHPVEFSFSTNSSPEQLIRHSHHLHRPLTITLFLFL